MSWWKGGASFIFLLLLLGVMCISEGEAVGNVTHYVHSCAAAKDTNFTNVKPNVNYYCTFVHWTTANIYDKSTYSHYNPGVMLSLEDQDAVARATADSLLAIASDSSACSRAIKWYACLQTFPYCPAASDSISSGLSYFSPCQLHCEQIHRLCGIDSHPLVFCDRTTKSTDNENCITYVPANSYLLPPERGPYESLPLFYATMLGIWILTTCLWFYLCSIWRNSPNPALLRLISIAFLIRIGLSVISRLFWVDCTEMKYYCPIVSVYNTGPAFRILEASQFFLFFIMGKGWTITRPNLATSEWFMAQLVTLAYLFTSFSFSDITVDAPNTSWVIFTCVLYAYVFVQILGLCWTEIQLLRSQLKRVTPDVPEERVAAIHMKLVMYQELLICVGAMTLLELICQSFFASSTVPVLATIVVYEVSSWLILVGVAFVFRPRELSPFFYMIPTTHLHHDQHRHDQPRPLSIISVKHSLLAKKNPTAATTAANAAMEASFGEIEVELSPLLPPSVQTRNNPNINQGDSVVVINRDDGEMALGVHLVRPARNPEDERRLMTQALNLFPSRSNLNRVAPRDF